jgi:hypothetical protein
MLDFLCKLEHDLSGVRGILTEASLDTPERLFAFKDRSEEHIRELLIGAVPGLKMIEVFVLARGIKNHSSTSQA